MADALFLQHEAPASLDEEMHRHLEFCSPEDATHPDLRAFFAYWKEARQRRSLPRRADLEPKAMRQYLRRIHLYEVIEGGKNFRCRLAGDAVFISYRTNLRGKLVTEHPHPDVARRIMAMLRHVVETARPLYARSIADAASASRHRLIENMWLPLGEADDVDHVVAQTIYPH